MAAKPPAPPTKEALVALQKSAYEAWKTRNATFWDTYLSDAFVGHGSAGRLDKAGSAKEFDGAACEVKSYAFSDEAVRPLGNDAALLTFSAAVDGTCGGQAVPSPSRGAAVYVRDGDRWKSAFHGDVPVIDPKTLAAKPAGKEASKVVEAKPAARDANTEALLALEKALWEAWRAHDAKQLEDLTASDMSFINIFGTHFATKAEALKDWTGTGCDVKSVSLTDAVATMFSPTVGILTFTGAADGTCFGQRVGPIWGTSVYVKDRAVWKWTFGINVPAPQS
jgi:ketosteroid isomerase-like protein